MTLRSQQASFRAVPACETERSRTDRGFNRALYRFNGQFDDLVYLPVVGRTYEWATPKFVAARACPNVVFQLADITPI